MKKVKKVSIPYLQISLLFLISIFSSILLSSCGGSSSSSNTPVTPVNWKNAINTGTLIGHTSSSIFSVAFNHDGTKLVSGADDDTVKIWDMTNNNTNIATLREHGGVVYSVAFNNSTRVAYNDWQSEHIITIKDITSSVAIATLSGHGEYVRSVAFNHDGTKLASGSADNTIKIWDMTDNSLITTLSEHGDDVRSVAFNHDGTRLASGSSDNTIKIWDVDAGTSTAIATLSEHGDYVHSVAFNHDSTKLASGSADNTIKIWDVDAGTSTAIATLTGHADGPNQTHHENAKGVKSVAFNHDGTRLASGGWDNTIKIWDMTDNTLIATLSGHGDGPFPDQGHHGVNSVTFNHDSTKLASGAYDNTIKIWEPQ